MIVRRPRLQFSLVDASGTIGNMSIALRSATDVAAAAAGAALFMSKVAPLTGAVFERFSVVYSQVESPRPAAAAGADASRVGGLIFSCATGELEIIEIHGVLDSLIQTTGAGAGILLDRTNPDLAALVDTLISGPWCNPFGFDIETLESAYLQIRR